MQLYEIGQAVAKRRTELDLTQAQLVGSPDFLASP